ncbi:MAG: LysR substrate-binding domain-containing protein [Hydrogenophaga sp.]
MILQDLDEAHAKVSSQTQELSGVLRILAPPVLATHILGPLVAGFRVRYRSIRLHIEVAAHREPPIEDFDINLLGADATFDANVVARNIISTGALLVAAPAHLARKKAPRSPIDLMDHNGQRITPTGLRNRPWHLFRANDETQIDNVDVQPAVGQSHRYADARGAGWRGLHLHHR